MSMMEVIFMERLILTLRVKLRNFYSLIKMSSTTWKTELNWFSIVSFLKREDPNSVANYAKSTESKILTDIHYSFTLKYTYLKAAIVNTKRISRTSVETTFKWKTVTLNSKSRIAWKCTKIVLNCLIFKLKLYLLVCRCLRLVQIS